MSGVEDISDDNDEEVDKKEEVSDEYQLPVDKDNKPTVDSINNVESSSAPLTDNIDTTFEDVVDAEDCNKDGGIDSAKAGNPDNALKVIAMCEFDILLYIFSCEDTQLTNKLSNGCAILYFKYQ